MADVFERRSELNSQRTRLWNLIEQTPWLDWLLLTKRPQNIHQMVPWCADWPVNVWLGTTVESQPFAEKRLPFLLQNAAVVRFLSCEPLLGPLDLSAWFRKSGLYPIDWVITGGESGPRSRPMHPDWVGNILRQCQRARVPFHFKQWGHWVPTNATVGNIPAQTLKLAEERPVKMIPYSNTTGSSNTHSGSGYRIGRLRACPERSRMGQPPLLLMSPRWSPRSTSGISVNE